MHADSEEIDSITVFAKLRENEDLRKVGGAPYLADLLQAFKSVANVNAYAHIIIDRWKIRKVNELGTQFQLIQSDPDEVPAALEAARNFLDEVDATQEDHALGFKDLYIAWTEHQEDDRPAIETPWMAVNDAMNGGLQRGRLLVVGARPGAGKTVMLTQLAVNAALSHHKCLFFSLELSHEDLAGRIMACGAHADYAEITRKNMSAETFGKVSRWAGAAADLPLTVDDTPGLTIEDISQRARIHQQRHGLDVLLIDYLQLMSPSMGGEVNRVQQVDHMAVRARHIARTLDITVVVAAQLNRSIENSGRPRLPTKADFRESGGIEQTCDAAVILSRPVDDNGEEATRLPLILATFVKNRQGVEQTVELVERFNQARLDNAS
jgi:replicative DNA helicase